MKWSNAQLKALEPIKGNMLISAGAGSGKTQVLSQKVHDVLASNLASPESILVVTFTVAAAFEMKQRIKQNLARNGVSKDIINKIDSAHIQTFDSFANFLVRKYASYLNISETINILDENIF
jgi:ATP-dependent helicase/nuclease subunit A